MPLGIFILFPFMVVKLVRLCPLVLVLVFLEGDILNKWFTALFEAIASFVMSILGHK